MATKSFKDICVEYATQLGKGLPLTPAEMCNAVIMYLNAQITEMQSITTALQTAVTEAESNATEALNTANSASEKVDTMNQAISDFEDEIGDPNYIAKLNERNVFTGDNTFSLSADANIFTVKNRLNLDNGYVYIHKSKYFVQFQMKNGTLALTSDIPDIPEPTTSDNGKIIGVENGEYVLVEQIGGSAPTKYFTRVICNDTNTNTLYIFSCITEGDFSGNNVYGDIVSLLTELGAINPTSALPCSGKTTSGGEVIGVYTDGSAITVFSGDNATEEIPTSAEITIISK